MCDGIGRIEIGASLHFTHKPESKEVLMKKFRKRFKKNYGTKKNFRRFPETKK